MSLGKELVPDPDFRVWNGAANPDNFPEGWTLGLSDADNFYEPGADGRGCRLQSVGPQTVSIAAPTGGLPLNTPMQVRYRYQSKVGGSHVGFRLGAGGTNTELDAPVGVMGMHTQVIDNVTTFDFRIIRWSSTTNCILDYLSVREIGEPQELLRRVTHRLTNAGQNSPTVDCATGHGVDLQITGTLTAGGIAVWRRRHGNDVTNEGWREGQTFTELGGYIAERQAGWGYKVVADPAFVGDVTVTIGQA